MGSKIVMGATGLMPVFQYILYESRRNGIVMRLVITDRCKVMDSKGVLGTYTMPCKYKQKYESIPLYFMSHAGVGSRMTIVIVAPTVK